MISKYIETIKINFKAQMAYRFDVITNIIFSVTKILLAYILWSAIFEKKEFVAGFTFNTMISYYIISTFISSLDTSSHISWLISSEIRNGSFSKYIVRPINIFGYLSAKVIGYGLFLLIFNVIALLAWFVFFDIEANINFNIINFIAVLCIVCFGVIFMLQINFFIGILAFKFLDTSLFIMIKDNILEFITGALIPLNLLPLKVLFVIKYLPFYYITYLPSMVILGRKQNEILLGFVILVLWNIIFALLNKFTYKKLKIKYDGVGI